MNLKMPEEAFHLPRLGYQPKWQEIAFVSLSINVLSLALPLITLQVYDRIILHAQMGTLNILCIGVIVAIIMEGILRTCRTYSMAWAGAVFEHTVACNVVRHKLEQKISISESDGVGDYLQRISAISKIRDFYSGQALVTLIDLPFIFVFLGLIAYFAGTLVLVPIAVLGLMGLLAWGLGYKLKSYLMERDDADETRYAFLIRTISSIHTVKAFGLEALLERHYERWQADSSLANYRVTNLSASAYNHGILASHLMMISVAVVGAPLILKGSITTGTLIACILLSGRIMQPLQKAMGVWTRLQNIELAYKKVSEHFAEPSVFNTTDPIQIENEGRIDIEDLSFSHIEGEVLLENVNLNLKLGEAITISGIHGAGKQTFLKLIAGMYPPTQGRIFVNGVEPHTLSSETLVQHVGYLPPDGAIFRGTIYDNLSRFGRVPEERVHEMAELLGIDKDVAILPAGYETKLEGGNADAVSPGLRQRIAIARVIAAKPRILLFYNADRALDKDGYNSVYKLLGRLKGRVTMVIVSNDHNTLRLADKHYILENGRFVEEVKQGNGNYSNSLPYQELWL